MLHQYSQTDMAGRHGNTDHAKLPKTSMTLDILLIATGVSGEVGLDPSTAQAPRWIGSVPVDAELLGTVVALLVVFAFGILRPLTEYLTTTPPEGCPGGIGDI